MRGKYGAARLALRARDAGDPRGSWGAQRVLPRWSKRISLFPRKDVEVIIGEQLDLSAWVGKHDSQKALAAATEAMMDAITDLVEELRGEHAPDGPRWDPAEHGQSEFGRHRPSQYETLSRAPRRRGGSRRSAASRSAAPPGAR